MNKKIITLITLTMLLSSAFSVLSVNAGVTYDEIEASIELGVPWLASMQNEDGSWGSGNKVARTGMAVIKLIDYAEKDLGIDWTDPDYVYMTRIENGLNYLFSQTRILNPSSQAAGDPDTNNNDKAVYFYGHMVYESAIGTMAIGATKTPDLVVSVPGSLVDGWTYAEVVQDCVDFFAYAQCEDHSYYLSRGGWGYNPNEQGSADNSVSGYVSLALGYAKNHDESIVIPDFVLDEMEFWISRIQSTAGYSYYRPGPNLHDYGDRLLKTGNLLYEMALVGYPVDDSRVVLALNYIDTNWAMADYQRAYCLMKGLEAYDITDEIEVGATGDWYNETATWIIPRQQEDGSFLPSDPHDGSYPYVLTASWALLTLEKATAPPANVPPVADFSAAPQPGYEGSVITFTDLSTDSDGVVSSWSWDFGDTGSSTEQNPTHTYTDDGPYTVTLTVTDDEEEAASVSKEITVLNVAPAVDAGPDQTVEIDSIVEFAGTFTDPGTDTWTYEWDFGDTSSASGSLTPSHTYTESGTYTVTLTVTDDDGGVGTDTLIVTVVSPWSMKEDAIEILQSHLGLYDKHVEHDIEQAIWHIEKSMEPELWVDETHLTWQHGNKVFDEEKLAVKELLHIVEWKDAPSDAVDMAYTVIEILVDADEWLAQVQYDDATVYAGEHKQIDHQLELALDEFSNAADELATDKKGHPKYDDAINAYNKAWQHAGLAIQHATK